MFAKVVVVKANGRFVMAVPPSSWLVDLPGRGLGLFAGETRHGGRAHNPFPDCEVGTMPPFGNLYGLPVYVDELLAKDQDIYFDAGTHKGAIKLRVSGFRGCGSSAGRRVSLRTNEVRVLRKFSEEVFDCGLADSEMRRMRFPKLLTA